MNNAIDYGLTLIGVKYKRWMPHDNGFNPICNNKPDMKQVKIEGICCCGLINLMFHHVNIRIPSTCYPFGGLKCYEYGYPKIEFDLLKVERGDILIRVCSYYDSGHIGVALGNCDDKILECYQSTLFSQTPGVTNINTVRELNSSYYGKNYFTYIIKAKDVWITK